METLVVPGLVAVTVCEPVLPTTVATETAVGVTLRIAGVTGGTGLEFAGEVTPMQPEVPRDAARSVMRNTRTLPRFESEKFNVVVLRIKIYSYGATRFGLCASGPAWTRTRVRECYG